MQLDATLLTIARGAGVRVIEQAQVTDLLYDGARVTGVHVREAGKAEPRALRAALVVGADGLRTRVGRRLGLVRRGRWPRRMALVAHFRGVRGIGAYGEMHVFSDGYVGLADVGQGVTNVALVVPSRWARSRGAHPDAMFASWLRDKASLSPRFDGASSLNGFTATGPFNVRARRAWAPGAALVGDAADFFDPFTGEGIYSALRGAELLLPYAFEACRESDARADTALAAYDRCRRNEFAGKWKVERLIGAAVASPLLMNFAAKRLAGRSDLADLLVGVAGDFVPPARVLHPGFILSMLSGASPRPSVATSPSPPTSSSL
jgi:flavin-dependent dehydrogenase